MGSNPTDRLAEYVAATRFEDLPTTIVEQTKLVILDTLACGIGALQTHASRKIRSAVEELSQGGGAATVLGMSSKVPVPIAAFANSELCHVLDADEVLLHASHIGVGVVPPALSASEWKHSSGKELITSVALGYDVAARIGLSMAQIQMDANHRPVYGEVSGHSYVVFGIAAAVSKLLNLSKAGTLNSFGIAGYSATVPTMGRHLRLGFTPDTKYTFFGQLAQAGVTASVLAENDFTGDQAILEGARGFWKIVGYSSCDYEFMTGDLGRHWWIDYSSLKPYPSCSSIIPILEAFEKISESNDLVEEDIDSIEIDLPETQMWLEKFAKEHFEEPDLPFNVPFLMALIVSSIPYSEWFRNIESVRGLALRLRKKTKFVSSDVMSARVVQQLRAEKFVRISPIILKIGSHGKQYELEKSTVTGDSFDPQKRMDFAQVESKARKLAHGIIDEPRISNLVATVKHLEELDDVTPIFEQLNTAK